MSQGVFLIAIGHINYLLMAETLAASIRVNDPGVKVSIITDNVIRYPELFDKIIYVNADMPAHYYKLHIPSHTPYHKTLYLDVDMILIPGGKVSGLFDQLAGISFTVMNKKSDVCIWADAKEVRRLSGNETSPLHIYYSELMYIERGKESKALFKEAQKQVNAKIEHRSFNGAMADELALILAALKLGVQPHADNFEPVFWFFRNKKDARLQPYELKNKYIAYSIGGNELPSYARANYDNLAKHYFNKLGLAKPYQAKDKRLFLATRSKI